MGEKLSRADQCRDRRLSLERRPIERNALADAKMLERLSDRMGEERFQLARNPIHPGEHLAEELGELNISAAELARQIDVPVNRITAILKGQRGVTADTALRLGHWFGTSAEFWLNLQTLYELRLAQKDIGATLRKLPRLADRRSA